MGLFGRKKKIEISQKLGNEAGELAEKQMMISFALTEHIENGTFNAPVGFYDDLYIKGYCTSFITTMADVGSASLGKRWSESDKYKFLMSGFERLVGLANVQNFITGAREASLSPTHRLGTLHANNQIKLIYTLKAMDLSLPIFNEAVELSESSDLYDVTSAFHVVTLGRHIQENYIA